MWISRGLSTTRSYPQKFPQVYPQVLPLLSTILSTSHIRKTRCIGPIYGVWHIFIHNRAILSTKIVDNSRFLRKVTGELSTGNCRRCGLLVDKTRQVYLQYVTKHSP